MTDQPVVEWKLVNDTTLLVLMQRPPANALGVPLIEGLRDAMDFADTITSLRTVVLASRIPGIFVAGADIKHMVSGDQEAFERYGALLRPQVERWASAEWVTIAAIDGLALGGGMELALASTLRVASGGASFGLPEVKLGLIPGAGGTQRLPRLVGQGRALDMMITARRVPGHEALAIGLADRLAADGEAQSEALRLAGEINQMSGSAQAAVIRCVRTSYDAPLPQGLAQEAAESAILFANGDAREGLTAFVEKRPPRFR
jgi:enoyl-CoA hydratase/carnithine racemase